MGYDWECVGGLLCGNCVVYGLVGELETWFWVMGDVKIGMACWDITLGTFEIGKKKQPEGCFLD